MAYEWIPAAITAGGSIISSLVGNRTHPGRRKLNRQKELAAYNQMLQDQSYEKYQSPTAMMRQYEEAGLNPNLIYGNAAPAGPGVAQVDQSAADYDDSAANADRINKAFAAVGAGVEMYQNIKGRQISNTNAQKTGDLLGEQTERERLDNDFKRASNVYKLEELAESVAQNKIRTGIMRETGLSHAKLELEEQRQRIQSSKLSRIEKRRQIEHLDKLDEQIDSVIDINKERVNEIKQGMEFAKDYHPYKIASMAISNMLGRQSYDQRGVMFDYERQGAAYDNALKHQKLIQGETLLPYQVDALSEKNRGQELKNLSTQLDISDRDVQHFEKYFKYMLDMYMKQVPSTSEKHVTHHLSK